MVVAVGVAVGNGVGAMVTIGPVVVVYLADVEK